MVKKSRADNNASNNESLKGLEVNENLKDQAADEADTAKNEQVEYDNNIINGDEGQSELSLLREQLEKKEIELKEYLETAQRVKAEFENHKRRTAREREQLYTEITGDIIAKLLPVIDNLERAISSVSETNDVSKLAEGIEMTLKQFKDVLNKEGVEEIEALGKQFDPGYHNAVMHIEDDSYDENTVIEVFQKGYMIKDKVLRYSMVKVAN